MSSRVLGSAKDQGAIGCGSVEPTSKVSTSRAAKVQGANDCGSGKSTSKLLTSSASAKEQRVGNGGNSQCFSVLEPTSNLSPSSGAEAFDCPATQSPISAAMLALMLLVPVKVDAQAVYNVLSVKHLDRIWGDLQNAATSAVPWAILTKTDVRARRDGLRALWPASSLEGGDSGSSGAIRGT